MAPCVGSHFEDRTSSSRPGKPVNWSSCHMRKISRFPRNRQDTLWRREFRQDPPDFAPNQSTDSIKLPIIFICTIMFSYSQINAAARGGSRLSRSYIVPGTLTSSNLSFATFKSAPRPRTQIQNQSYNPPAYPCPCKSHRRVTEKHRKARSRRSLA